jgi:glycogen debranching enzyme
MLAVFDRYGDIEVVGLGQQGIFHEGTRFLSRLVFRISQSRPLLLSSAVREDISVLTIDLSNLDVDVDGQVVVPRGSVYVARSKFLWKGVCYEQFKISNYSLSSLQVPLSIRFDADFADIFEVRGTKREHRGQRLPDIVEDGAVTLVYEGLDGVERRTKLRCSPQPSVTSGSEFQFTLSLEPRAETDILLSIACEIGGSSYEVQCYEPVLKAPENQMTAIKN